MTTDKTKLRELATAAIKGPNGCYSIEARTAYWDTASPETILALLDELQAMTDDRDEYQRQADAWKDISVRSANDAICCAHERDELKRLAKAHLAALEAEAKASNTHEVAENNYSDPKQERAAHGRAIVASMKASKVLRKAVES